MSFKSQHPYRYSIGVPVYNEEKNLESFIHSVAIQENFIFDEIFFIVSGCTDSSERVIQRCIGDDTRCRVLRQEKREGKSLAINAFLKEAKGEILILISADTMLDKYCLSKVAGLFSDATVGMAGAHPIPFKNTCGITYLMNKVLWDLHHALCLKKPKLGELVAFRNIIKKIPFDIVADEAYIEALILKNGYSLCYTSDALVYNRCPVTVKDFFWQRMRIFWGHLDVKKKVNYAVASMDKGLLLGVVVRYCVKNFHTVVIITILCVLELLSRTVALCCYYCMRKIFPYMYIWSKYNK
ncbi:MAG: glycosyltransferase [Candidatus Omnitrophica bacterium]|nr:glycosyltransferase [Candidatus Omnitrophota bacterium]